MDGTEADTDIVALCHCKAHKALFLVDTTTGLPVRRLGEGVKYIDADPKCDPGDTWVNAGSNKQIIFGLSCPTSEDMSAWGGNYNMMDEALALASGKSGWIVTKNNPPSKAPPSPVLRVGGKLIFPTYSLPKEKIDINTIKKLGTGEIKMPPYDPANPDRRREPILVSNTTWTVALEENPRFVLVTENFLKDGKLNNERSVMKYFPQFPVLVFTYHGPKAAGRRTKKSKRPAKKTRRRHK